jgi:hypothetical protein
MYSRMVSRSSNSSQYQNRVFCDSGLKTFKVQVSSRADVRNTKTITYDTVSTTTSSNMHESHVAILNNIPVIKK